MRWGFTNEGVALAVSAMIGVSGNRCRKTPNRRYSGRKSFPHSEMQCAYEIDRKGYGSVLKPTSSTTSRFSSRCSYTTVRCLVKSVPQSFSGVTAKLRQKTPFEGIKLTIEQPTPWVTCRDSHWWSSCFGLQAHQSECL